jgi:hypothetical protein
MNGGMVLVVSPSNQADASSGDLNRWGYGIGMLLIGRFMIPPDKNNHFLLYHWTNCAPYLFVPLVPNAKMFRH